METVLGEEPVYTNYTRGFRGTLDYIWYTPKRLRVTAGAALPEEQELQIVSGDGLPCTCYPSDHL